MTKTMTSKTRRTRVAAYGVLTQNDEVLLCRISDQLPRHHGKWTLPGGGIEFGEQPNEAVVREFEEETGLTIRVEALKHVDSVVVETEEETIHSVRIIYAVSLVGGELRFETDGTTDMCQWWPSTTLPEMVDIAVTGVGIAFG